MKITLVAVSGISPAIITETLWALGRETPTQLPDDVVIITTTRGESDLTHELLSKRPGWGGKSVWETLRTRLLEDAGRSPKSGKLQLSIRVIDLPDEASGIRRAAADLRTRTDNDECADFIVRTIAPYCDAEDNHVIASIAGGRKTMGALLYAAMSLLGKETDRVTHVLVNEPFERVAGFFYPDQPVQQLAILPPGGTNQALLASDVKIEMADIPFVPLRNKFDELNEPRRTFAGLVERYSRLERSSLEGPPPVEFDSDAGTLTVAGRLVKLTGRDFIVSGFLFDRARRGLPHFRDRGEATPHLAAFVAEWKRQHPSHRATNRLSGDLSEDDLTKALASLRGKLRQAGLEGAIRHLAPERSRIGFDIH